MTPTKEGTSFSFVKDFLKLSGGKTIISTGCLLSPELLDLQSNTTAEPFTELAGYVVSFLNTQISFSRIIWICLLFLALKV